MRTTLFIFLLLPVLTFAQKPECDCNLYQTGSFYTLGPEGSGHDTLFITRTINAQTETVGTDYNKKNKVIWLTPCKFILRDAENPTTKKYHSADVIVQIIETYDDRYVVKAWAPHKKKIIMTVYVKK